MSGKTKTSGATSESKSSNRKNAYDLLAQKLYLCVQDNDISRSRHLIKGLSKKDMKRKIASYTFEGNTPLFLAAKSGYVHFVKHLLEDWHSDIEQKGVYIVASDHSRHKVSPLWCASVADNLDVVKMLVEHGADKNAPSDTDSTPVRSACYMTNIAVIRYLVEQGSDIHKPNHNGGTCLINAVQSAELCLFLIQNGVDVNAQDNSGNLALHYAIREGRMESVKLLLANGSNALLKNDFGDDALVTASLRGNSQILEYLILEVEPPLERIIDAYELMATNFVDEKHDLQAAIEIWRKAMKMRYTEEDAPILKQVSPASNPAYLGMHEARNIKELEDIAASPESIYMHSLLTRERILGPDHKDTVFGLMYRGAVYADTSQYQRCVEMWKYAFMLRHDQDNSPNSECIFTLQALCKLFWEIHDEFIGNHTSEPVRFDDVLDVLRMAVKEIVKTKKENVKPSPLALAYEAIEPAEGRNILVQLVLHLVHLLCKICTTRQHEVLVKEQLALLLRANVQVSNGRSLLHLAADKKISNVTEEFYSQFPSVEVVRALIDVGCNVDALDADRNSVLHVCAEGLNQLLTQRKYRETLEEIVELLLDHGAHIDIVNKRGINACMLLQNRCPRVCVIDHITLKCMAARVVREKKLPYKDGIVPHTLVPFIELH